MDTEKDAIAILHDAERSLRDLIGRRLKEQRYGDVAAIARYADGLSNLLQNRPDTLAAQGRSPAEGDPPVPVVLDASARRNGSAAPPRQPNAAKKKEYPRFVRQGDRLVKIGWSKTNKSTYEHKAPYEAVTAVIRQLAAKATPGKVFSVDDILPVPDISNNGEVPVYQVYLTLAWLRHLGLVIRRAKDGYIPQPSALDFASIGQAWSMMGN